MACFVVPIAEAVAVTVAYAVVKHREKKKAKASEHGEKAEKGQPFSKKLLSLVYLLLGGAALLAFEHLWHGEIMLAFPFLSAVRDGTVNAMLFEMATTGVAMAVLCTLVWGVVLLVKHLMARTHAEKKAE